jgi:hypothetical protein
MDGDQKRMTQRLLELFAAGVCQFVELGAEIILRHAPFGGNPPLPLDPVERRLERAFFHTQHVLRHLHDSLIVIWRPCPLSE